MSFRKLLRVYPDGPCVHRPHQHTPDSQRAGWQVRKRAIHDRAMAHDKISVVTFTASQVRIQNSECDDWTRCVELGQSGGWEERLVGKWMLVAQCEWELTGSWWWYHDGELDSTTYSFAILAHWGSKVWIRCTSSWGCTVGAGPFPLNFSTNGGKIYIRTWWCSLWKCTVPYHVTWVGFTKLSHVKFSNISSEILCALIAFSSFLVSPGPSIHNPAFHLCECGYFGFNVSIILQCHPLLGTLLCIA